jgi:NADH dehydrogenase
MAQLAEMIPGAPLTRTQVELMEFDTVVASERLGFHVLSIMPRPIPPTLDQIIAQRTPDLRFWQ